MTSQPTQREYWSGKAGEEWAAHAERIDAMLAPIAEAALRAGAFQPGERVLDIGCGAGATSVEIARRVAPGGSVTGVDISPQMLHVARERARAAKVTAEFIEADAGAATFERPFDAAFSRFGVMFFEAPAPAFANIRRALRPGGRLTFVCWRPIAENPWATIPIAAIEPMLKTPLQTPDPDAPGPYALAEAGKIERVLGEAGWRDIALTHWDGALPIGGPGTLAEIASFVLKIGPCARAIADQALDAEEALRRLIERLEPLHRDGSLQMQAACWIATANA
jgi:SAM-dependent methyltransferase